MKESYYFPHFCNARHDRKIKRLRKELGVEGYGIYFMLLEVLREQQDMRYPLSDIDLIADEFNTSEQKIITVIKAYELFEIDDQEKFFSPKMLVYLEPYFRMKEQRRIAGIESGKKRKANLLQEKNDRSTDNEQQFNENEQSKVKESKVKESKVNKNKEKYITVSEFENISIEENKIEEFNSSYEKHKLEWMVKKLDSWLETKKKKCNGIRSFKAYCNNWVEESYNAQKVGNASQNNTPYIPQYQSYEDLK